MRTVLIQLRAPLQSWGSSTRWEHRHTHTMPTKSALLGLVANCLGRTRSEDITDLAATTFAVRADRPGHLLVEDQTCGGSTMAPSADSYLIGDQEPAWWGPPYNIRINNRTQTLQGKHERVVLVTKHYLADAGFVASLTGETPLITTVAQALRSPARLPYLGRRACVPSYPLYLDTLEPREDPHAWTHQVPLRPWATTNEPPTLTEASDGHLRLPTHSHSIREHSVTFANHGRVIPPDPDDEHPTLK